MRKSSSTGDENQHESNEPHMQAAINSHRDANIIEPGDLVPDLPETRFSFCFPAFKHDRK
jgi:hypothetical protein